MNNNYYLCPEAHSSSEVRISADPLYCDCIVTVSLGPYLLSALQNSGVPAFQGLLMYVNIIIIFIRIIPSGPHAVSVLYRVETHRLTLI